MTLAGATAVKSRDLEVSLAVYQLMGPPPPDAGLPAVVAKIISLFDGKRSLADVCDAAQISVPKGQAVVRKLTQLGIVGTRLPQARGDTTAGRSAPGFSALEEAFFASEVSPIDECDEVHVPLSERIELWVSELLLKLKGSPACY